MPRPPLSDGLVSAPNTPPLVCGPLLLDSRNPGESEFRPWASGELFPERMSSPENHGPAELLAKWWRHYADIDQDDDVLSADERLAVTAPFGRTWPGLAPSLRPVTDPDETADEFARVFATRRPQSRLGLVSSARGADALAAVGWDGPVNYDNDTAKYAAVVRDWERRFGARVVAVGSDTLHLSVAAPPTRGRGPARCRRALRLLPGHHLARGPPPHPGRGL